MKLLELLKQPPFSPTHMLSIAIILLVDLNTMGGRLKTLSRFWRQGVTRIYDTLGKILKTLNFELHLQKSPIFPPLLCKE